MSRLDVKFAGDLPVEELLDWRMEVLRCVFELPDDADLSHLRNANRAYYRQALADGTHIPCMAYLDGEPVGCGALCLQREMPSPDNPSGLDAYLMNVYTRPAARGLGAGRAICRWLVAKAHELGAGKIYLETTEAGRPLYTSLGFRDLPDMMKLQDAAQ
ncbi:MAG: GNAT family N-acetyltransferase [Eggerthellaceae bacterium]|jgi:GNAT superfamily N-acetyltransferase